MMDADSLKKYAELLEKAIQESSRKSDDVAYLASYTPLLKAIEDAKNGSIKEPLDLGLSRWVFESNIQNFGEVSERLAQFSLLLRGWRLPSEVGGGGSRSEDA